MISEELKKDYLKWSQKVIAELDKDRTNWLETYTNYAKDILKYQKKFEELRKKFNRCKGLHLYLTIGNMKNGKYIFDLRYLGQSVGTISVNKEKVLLTVSDTQAENSKKYFGYDEQKIGKIKNAEWGNSYGEAAKFRKFFKECASTPRIKEHMVESALFTELEKKQSKNKTLCRITPISTANARIHMVTEVSASKAKNDIISLGKGGVDLLCRRSFGNKSRLVVIEVKDENKSSESFDKAMKQAISYALFLRELIHSKAGKDWMKIWGLENQRRVAEEKKTGYTIECVVAMPKGTTTAGYDGDLLDFDNGDGTVDHLALHYMAITSNINPKSCEDVKFETSIRKKTKA